MKKVLGILTVVLCVCFLMAMPVSAATDPMAVKFDGALGLLDYFYDYDYNYMIRIASDAFINWDDSDSWWKPTSVPAEEFDAVLRKHFVITDQQIEELREFGNRDYSVEIWDDELGQVVEEIPFYDAETQIYTFENYGGFGGSLPPRQYLGYVNNGETYDVYYQNITYAYLRDYLPDGVDEDEYAGDLDWPEFIELEGIRFEGGPDGYYAVLSYDDFGRKYTVEMNGDIVRLISCEEYTAKDLPDAFDDKAEEDVSYDLPENGEVSIPENDCFAPGTVVQVEKLTGGEIYNVAVHSMEKIANKFSAFEFTAKKDDLAVQPSGKLAVTFAIPEGYSLSIAVYYMDPTGKLEELSVTVNAAERTVTVLLEHFSTYIIADSESKPHQHTYTSTVTPPTCTAEGYTTFNCTCGDSYVDNKVAKTDHNFGQWTQTKAPTATEEGEEKRICADCQHAETRAIAKQEPAPETDSDSPVTSAPETDSNSPVTSAPETQPAPAPESEGETADEGSSTGLLIGIAVAVVAVGAVVALLLAKKKK